MAGRFSGKTAVITGSGRRKGLGEAIALRLAQELRLRLYILRVLRASLVLAEGALMSWVRGGTAGQG